MYVTIPRGEALRALITGIYDASREKRYFCTNDVFLHVKTTLCSTEALRHATAKSKLIAVALRKVASSGAIRRVDGVRIGDKTCHSRPKAVWERRA